jgi:hypothetical protein
MMVFCVPGGRSLWPWTGRVTLESPPGDL